MDGELENKPVEERRERNEPRDITALRNPQPDRGVIESRQVLNNRSEPDEQQTDSNETSHGSGPGEGGEPVKVRRKHPVMKYRIAPQANRRSAAGLVSLKLFGDPSLEGGTPEFEEDDANSQAPLAASEQVVGAPVQSVSPEAQTGDSLADISVKPSDRNMRQNFAVEEIRTLKNQRKKELLAATTAA